MLRLLERLLPGRRPSEAYHCILRFPDSTETRWLSQLPTRGMRIRSHGGDVYLGQVWIVDEVLQSGRDTYTIFCVDQREYFNSGRWGSGDGSELAAELLELARRTASTVTEQRRRWQRRQYRP